MQRYEFMVVCNEYMHRASHVTTAWCSCDLFTAGGGYMYMLPS